jgi:hypothetical protein
MFDIQYEVGILRDRLRAVLALECLDSVILCEAYCDFGYINCILDYSIMIDSEDFETLETAIMGYEELSC